MLAQLGDLDGRRLGPSDAVAAVAGLVHGWSPAVLGAALSASKEVHPCCKVRRTAGVVS